RRGDRQPREGCGRIGGAEPQRDARYRRADGTAVNRRPPLVLKLGGGLLQQTHDLARVAKTSWALANRAPLAVVHRGGEEIDPGLATGGIPNRQVEGLRVTDARRLDVVVAVLAGAINTRLVAAVRRAGGKPVGLTGADASVATMRRAAPIVSVSGASV